MYLKPDEIAMLNGEEGRLRQEAMKFLVELGEVFHAEKMVDIQWAYAYAFGLVDDIPNEDLPPILSKQIMEEAIETNRCLKIPTTGSLAAIDMEHWKEFGCSEETYMQIRNNYELERRMGMIYVPSCTPYLYIDMNRPACGTHMITTESSAIVYYNSVLGARAERCGNAALLAAITGKYPAIGLHLDENRYATIQIDVKTPIRGITDYGRLGIFIGEICGMDVPVITGIESMTTPELIQFGAGCATGGAVALYHIPGITAEFRTLEEALNGKKPVKVVEYGEKEAAEMHNRFPEKKGEEVNTILIGCPQMTIYQLREVANCIHGRHIAPNIEMYLNITSYIRKQAIELGFYEDLERAGIHMIVDSCPLVWQGVPGPQYAYTHPEFTTGTLATNSVKCAAYAKQVLSADKVLLGNVEDCIEAAISGKWKV